MVERVVLNNQSDREAKVIKILKLKPGDIPIWVYGLIAVFFGIRALLGFFGIELPDFGKTSTSVGRDVALELVQSNESNTQALKLMAIDYTQYRERRREIDENLRLFDAITEERIQTITRDIERNEEQIKDIRKILEQIKK